MIRDESEDAIYHICKERDEARAIARELADDLRDDMSDIRASQRYSSYSRFIALPWAKEIA